MESNFDLLVTVLDSSTSWCITSVIALFLFLILLLGRVFPFRRINGNNKLKLFLSVLITLPLVTIILLWIFIGYINPNYLGYGYSTQIPTIIVNDEHSLWLLDRNTNYYPEMGSKDTYRIQGVDLSNGKKQFRRIFNAPIEVRYISNGKVWLQLENGLILLDLNNGKTIQAFNRENLAAENPSIKGKIHEFYLDTPSCRIVILLTDGSRELINTIPTKSKVKPKIPRYWQPTLDGQQLLNADGEIQFSLKADGARANLIGIDQQPLASELYFLNGRFIAADTKQRIFLFSEEQLGGTRFLLHCLTKEGKLRWQHVYETPRSKELSKQEFITAFMDQGNLVIQVGQLIMCLDSSSGKTKWSIRI
jgi:outer membrane protein assembly factor BamB